MVEKFNQNFNYDSTGAQRNWKIYEDEEFNKIFAESRRKLEP